MMRPEARDLLGETSDKITDDWLGKIGFKWHQMDRQPDRHWLLWLGDALEDQAVCYEDLGIELSRGSDGERWYFCWLRSDAAGRYQRFLHVRRLYRRGDLFDLILGLTGQCFNPDHAWYGGLRTPERARRLAAEYDRMDLKIMRSHPWHESEKDDTKGGPLIDHMHVADDTNGVSKGLTQ